jgi:hypothetical protein
VIVFFMLVVAALANAESHDEHTGAVHHGEPDPSSDSRSALPESRNASGTAWQPDSTPMHGLHFMKGTWTMMAHWNFFGGYDHQGSDRGDSQWLSTNWGMLMEKRSVGAGELVLRQMLTLEPFTVGAAGYPLLLQTGESFNGAPIHDRQHPHDLFMAPGVRGQDLVGGYEFPFFRTQRFSLDLGARASVNLVDDDLEPFYGSSKPTGYMIFLHLYPGEMAQMPPGHRM